MTFKNSPSLYPTEVSDDYGAERIDIHDFPELPQVVLESPENHHLMEVFDHFASYKGVDQLDDEQACDAVGHFIELLTGAVSEAQQ